jgi:monoamine oxidase
MARTPLMQRLQETVSAIGEADARSIPVEQVFEERVSRRRFLRDAGIAGLGVTAAGRWAAQSRAAAAPTRIVVVGAGLAGLTCAYRLYQAGQKPLLYEVLPDRVGGRCWTIKGPTSPFGSQIAEHGGELIDQGHTHIRQLAQELGFKLDNLLSAEVNGTEPFYYFDGKPYPFAEATDDLKAIYQTLHSDVSAASYPTLFDNYTPRGYELDHLSIIDWLNESIPDGGADTKLGQLLDVAYNIEYGAESSVQSSLNLLYLLGYSGQGQLRIFGPSNEKYHVNGGNDQIPAELGARLSVGGLLKSGRELIAIKLNSGGSYTLTFRRDLATETVVADHVVLALPFSILRSSVNYSQAGFSKLKKTAIQELGMGTNSKLHLQFSQRYWNTLGCNGETYADTGYQNTWEVTRAQSGTPGILVDYTGGRIGASFGSGTLAFRAQQFLAQLEPVLPGISPLWNQRATLDFWTAYPWTKGSYSYWKVGQYTKFSGIESRRSGNCHFCGEHTSQDFQGYLNGGVETGARAAGEILGDLKK